MDERMTLEQVRDWHREKGKLACCDRDEEKARLHDAMFNAIDTHLTQPAQAVDVGAIREVIEDVRKGQREGLAWSAEVEMADKLTRAIGNAQAEADAVERACVAHYESWAVFHQWERETFRRDMKRAIAAALTPPTQATPNAHE